MPPPAEWLPLDQAKDRIDAFFVSPDGASLAAAEIARRYHKPLVLLEVEHHALPGTRTTCGAR